MPKISGTNIVEHVANQEQAVFDAAVELFTEHGAANVTVSQIAERVGLARTSLYRYYPTKAAIVHQWFNSVIDPLITQSAAIAASDSSRAERLDKWVELELDFHADPDNQAMIRASLEADDMPEDIRQEIGQRHQDLYQSLTDILTTDSADAPTVQARVQLIANAIHSLINMQHHGIPIPTARNELTRVTAAIADL